MALQCDNELWVKMTVSEISLLFNNPVMSDIKFTCGEARRKYFYANKYVLATSSSVFFAMFYGDLAEKGSVIHLPDTDEESLEEFLRFLYTDDCTLTAEIAMKVMYLAKKYIIPSLTEKCIEVVEENLHPDNVAIVLEQALHFDEKGLANKCWRIVESHTSRVITSQAFSHISQRTLVSILKRDKLSGIKEIELFTAVLKWSDTQCKKNDRKPTGGNRRKVVGEAVFEIRFPCMSEDDFSRNVPLSGLLTDEEIVSIYQKFNGFVSSGLNWQQPKRSESIIKHFQRCGVPQVKPAGLLWKYRGNPDRLSFSINKPALLLGVYLFGDVNKSKYEVVLEVDDVRKVSGTYTSQRNNDGVCGFEVLLATPVSVKQNKVVSIAATIKGPRSCYCCLGREWVKVDGAVLTFGDGKCGPSNGTDKTAGQFFEIILATEDEWR